MRSVPFLSLLASAPAPARAQAVARGHQQRNNYVSLRALAKGSEPGVRKRRVKPPAKNGAKKEKRKKRPDGRAKRTSETAGETITEVPAVEVPLEAPKVEALADSCRAPQYDPLYINYAAGDEVEVESSIFVCLVDPYTEYCNIFDMGEGWDDGKKELWRRAWEYVGPCEAAVSLEATAADMQVEAAPFAPETTSTTTTTEATTTQATTTHATTTTQATTTEATTTTETADAWQGDSWNADGWEGDSWASDGWDGDSWTTDGWASDGHSTEAPAIVTGGDTDCTTQMCSYQLSDDSLLNYQVNLSEGSVSMELVHEGEAWLGLAFSTNGRMVGSEAVLGVPGESVQKYILGGKSTGAIEPLAEEHQTLVNTTIEIVDGQTIMKFTKILEEEGEIEIHASGTSNTMLFAHGAGAALGYHGPNRMAFELVL